MDLPYRPCGACGELVPSDTGCTHWRKPGTYRERQRERKAAVAHRRATKERVEAELASFRRMMGLAQ